MLNSSYSVNNFIDLVDKKRAAVKRNYKHYKKLGWPCLGVSMYRCKYETLSRMRDWLIHCDGDIVVTYHEGQLHLLYYGYDDLAGRMLPYFSPEGLMRRNFYFSDKILPNF